MTLDAEIKQVLNDDAFKRATGDLIAEKKQFRAEIRALRTFAKAVEQMDESTRRANIGWLADRYLGVRIR